MTNSEFQQFAKPLLKDINKWRKEFMDSQPNNLQVDYDTFEGSAYGMLGSAAILIKDFQTHSKISASSLDLYSWLVELKKVQDCLDFNEDIQLTKTINELSELIKDSDAHKHNSKSKSR